jgi:hypothetical protein
LYLPDIELPDTEPVYVAPAPTAPKVMALPRTLPPMRYFPLGFESVIDPLSFDPDCVQ